LLRDEYEVICVDNFLTGRQENVETLFHLAKFSVDDHDVTRDLRIPGPVDVVFHLAAGPGDPRTRRVTFVDRLRRRAGGPAGRRHEARETAA
jgi:nucleoside-diphosphate-sugar epimerase